MSATGLSPQSSSSSSSKLFNNNKPFHHRNSSAELDVFEAANYFSGYYNEVPSHYTITNNNKVIARGAPAGRRMSLDSGMIHTHQIIIKDNNIKNVGSSNTNGKQHKQPSSPGARLASFLNQLFHHGGTTGSGLNKNKTKKSKPPTKDEDHEVVNANGGGRRKRRSSISNITRSWYYSTSTGTGTSTSTCTSSSSAHLPPQPAANYSLPSKANKGFNQKAVSPLPIKSNGGLVDEKVANYKGARSLNNGHGDGYESDSSSDLFELQNYDSDVYSNGGLPVYDTTDVVSRVSASTIS